MTWQTSKHPQENRDSTCGPDPFFASAWIPVNNRYFSKRPNFYIHKDSTRIYRVLYKLLRPSKSWLLVSTRHITSVTLQWDAVDTLQMCWAARPNLHTVTHYTVTHWVPYHTSNHPTTRRQRWWLLTTGFVARSGCCQIGSQPSHFEDAQLSPAHAFYMSPCGIISRVTLELNEWYMENLLPAPQNFDLSLFIPRAAAFDSTHAQFNIMRRKQCRPWPHRHQLAANGHGIWNSLLLTCAYMCSSQVIIPYHYRSLLRQRRETPPTGRKIHCCLLNPIRPQPCLLACAFIRHGLYYAANRHKSRCAQMNLKKPLSWLSPLDTCHYPPWHKRQAPYICHFLSPRNPLSSQRVWAKSTYQQSLDKPWYIPMRPNIGSVRQLACSSHAPNRF